MDAESIRKTLNSGSGRELKKYLLAKALEMRDIENVQEFQTAAAQTLEIKAQKRAYLKLKEILKDLLDFEEEPKVKDPRDSFEVL